MLIAILVICAVFVLLNKLRYGIFHMQSPISFSDPIYCFVGISEDRKSILIKKLLYNICFILICVLIACVAHFIFLIDRKAVLSGIVMGVFCMVWPHIYTYRLYAFWHNPAALVYFLLFSFEIVYAVCMADFALTGNPITLLALLIPIIGGQMRKWTDETRMDYLEELSFQTKLYTRWKQIYLREPPFLKKYGTYIEKACQEYDLPPRFVTRRMLLGDIQQGPWYCRLGTRIIPALSPRLCWRLDCSVGVGLIKPKTVQLFFGGTPEEIIKTLRVPQENIRMVARIIRKLLDGYPGAGQYLSPEFIADSRFGSIEYDALDETAQLCRYVACQYNVGKSCSRLEFADIAMEILLKSDADLLLKTNKTTDGISERKNGRGAE